MQEPRDPTPEAFASEPLRTSPINAHPVTGRPMDGDERVERRDDERYAVLRYPSFADDKTMLCVMDQETGRMLGGQLLPTATITAEDERYILARIKRDLPQPIRPPLKLCG